MTNQIVAATNHRMINPEIAVPRKYPGMNLDANAKAGKSNQKVDPPGARRKIQKEVQIQALRALPPEGVPRNAAKR